MPRTFAPPQGTAAQAPTPPTPPAPPAVAGVTPAGELPFVFTLPRTPEELRALRAARSELSSQLNSAVDRREELVEQLQDATGANRAGIEARLRLLDERIVQIERDIASSGQLLATARGTIVEPPAPPVEERSVNSGDIVAIVGILSVFVFFPLAVTYARMLWKRGSQQKVETLLEQQNAERLARLEGAVDAIAIEMERVSEGQRFVTRLLAESEQRAQQRIGG